MINKLTGMLVSDETLKVLERLSSGEIVPYEEIKELPEIQEAYSFVNNATETIDISNRDNFRLGITKQLFDLGSAIIDTNGKVTYNGEVGRDYRVDIVIGLPASGKSSALVDPLSQEFHSRVIDSDMAKELIPEFNSGWGAGVVHKESKQIINVLRSMSVINGENIIYPIVGSNLKKVTQTIHAFNAVGYDVYLHYCELAPAKALGRMLSRFFECGRFLDPKLIAEYGNRPQETFEHLKGVCKHESKASIINDHSRNGNGMRGNGPLPNELDSRAFRRTENSLLGRNSNFGKDSSERSGIHQVIPIISGYSHWSNDVPRGHSPILIETTCKGTVFEKGVENHFRRELQQNGFIPTGKLLDSCIQLYNQTGKLSSLRDICSLYKNPDTSLSPAEQETINKIGNLCRAQEAQRCPSFSCSKDQCPET